MKQFWLQFFSLSLVLTSFLSAEKGLDPWKGDEYAKNSESQKASANDLLQTLQFRGTESILDVGCGDGKITAAMARAVPQGSVVGVDISPSMIQMAEASFSQEKNLRFYIEDAAQIHFENQFDLVTSFTVMQWVLDQGQALTCIERALKPGGRAYIQLPMGLPKAMETALEKTLLNPRWKNHFIGFSVPWRFYQVEEYRSLLEGARLIPTRITVSTKHERFASREQFHGFLKQWFPYLRVLPADQKEDFLTELLDHYLSMIDPDAQGRVSFIVDRLEVEAVKSLTVEH